MAILRWLLVVLSCVGCVETNFKPLLLIDMGTTVDTCEEAAHYVVDDCEVFGEDRLIPLANACNAGEDEPWTRCALQRPTPGCLDLHFCAEAGADAGPDQGNGGGQAPDLGTECFDSFDCPEGLICGPSRRCVLE